MTTPRRMIIVDDDPKVRLLLERAFRAPEFETHSFARGKAVLERVSQIKPDCVVSDILMPDMDGESLLRALRAVPGLEAVPFIALSAVRSEARIRSVIGAGADAFLLKPFPLRELTDKVRSLVERPRPASNAQAPLDEDPQPTRPVVTAPHTMSTASVRRRQQPDTAPAALPAPAPTPKVTGPDASSPMVVRMAGPVRVLTAGARPTGEMAAARRIELAPQGPGLGFGRFTRVELRGRSFVVLTEATAQPRFTVTTVVTEKGVPLRKIETALPHPLAREEDVETVRRQLDLQHDEVLRRLDYLVLDGARRRVLWSDQSRSVDAGLLAWTVSAVAQLAETEIGTEETARQLHLTRDRALGAEDALRAFQITPAARVVVEAGRGQQLPRRAVRAVAGWCRDFATSTLLVDADKVAEPVRQATRRHADDLERMGFYDRLRRRSRA